MLPIWYVHGAGASVRSFAWLRTQLPPHQPHLFSYGADEGLAAGIARLSADMALADAPGLVIGHSLGGLIGAGVIGQPACRGLVTLSAPFGGLPMVLFLTLFRKDQVLRDLSPFNPVLRGLGEAVLASGKPFLPIVGTGGLSFLPGDNDGVVSVDSQTAIIGADYHKLPLNHFETLLADEAATLICDFVQRGHWS
jgi:pimeloyl-ACP methyl ester carboxylesterase